MVVRRFSSGLVCLSLRPTFLGFLISNDYGHLYIVPLKRVHVGFD